MSDFKVGDKIVCIDDKWQDDLTLGKFYTVVDRTDGFNTPIDRVNIIDDTGSDYLYHPTRFRLATLLERELSDV